MGRASHPLSPLFFLNACICLPLQELYSGIEFWKMNNSQRFLAESEIRSLVLREGCLRDTLQWEDLRKNVTIRIREKHGFTSLGLFERRLL